MNWQNIKSNIIFELNDNNRNLKNPQIRTNALEKIENMLKELILSNPSLLLILQKELVISELSKMKKLNSAEKSIVNHVFSVLNNQSIPINKRK